jgi:integrase
MGQNIASGIKNLRRDRKVPRANRPWRDEERFAVLDAAPIHLKVPIALAMYTGLREGDALTVRKEAYDGERLRLTTGKTGQIVTWPVVSTLKGILDSAPAHDAETIAVTSRGKSWTMAGFRASWRNFRLRLETEGKIGPGLTIHGLRHTVATNMAEEGFDSRTIADALGQATESMALHYSRDADRSRKMDAVAARLDQAEREKRSKQAEPAN